MMGFCLVNHKGQDNGFGDLMLGCMQGLEFAMMGSHRCGLRADWSLARPAWGGFHSVTKAWGGVSGGGEVAKVAELSKS